MKNYWESLSNIEKIRLVISLLIGLFIFLFIVLNWNQQDINFIFLNARLPLSIAIILSIGAGYLLSRLLSYRKSVKKDFEYKILKKKIAELENKLGQNKEIEKQEG